MDHIALVCLLLLAVGSQVVVGIGKCEATLGNVCENLQVPIGSVMTAERLIRDLEENQEELRQEKYRQSFLDLEKLLLVNWDAPLCSEEKFALVRDYHFRYIAGSQFRDIPISLARFFEAWALQVSGLCKRLLVDNIHEAMQLMSSTDRGLLESGAIESSRKALMGPGESQEEVGRSKPTAKPNFQFGLSFNKSVYLPELEGELKEGDIGRREEAKVLDLRSSPELDKVMHACERSFRPIYSKLVMPVVRLSKLGYDYVGPQIDDIRAKLYEDPLISKWLLVTMVCESQGRIELVELESEQPQQGRKKKEQPLEYDPVYTPDTLDDPSDLWIQSPGALRKEFERISDAQSTGFKKFLYEVEIAGRRVVSRLNTQKFAWNHKDVEDDS